MEYKENRTNDPVISSTTEEWIYEIPPRTDAKVQLLTIGGVQTSGQWRGAFGEFFVAYAKLPKRNKHKERELGILGPHKEGAFDDSIPTD